MKESKPFPLLVVVDLDYTLWPGFCEYYGPPHVQFNEHQVECTLLASNTPIRFVLLSPFVFSLLQNKGSRLAIASRVHHERRAEALLGALGLLGFFAHREIHRGPKSIHLRRIAAVTGIAPQDMLFFDDQADNGKHV
ncbi:unnamed protein product, partial [Phaeothamnion confervicola]